MHAENPLDRLRWSCHFNTGRKIGLRRGIVQLLRWILMSLPFTLHIVSRSTYGDASTPINHEIANLRRTSPKSAGVLFLIRFVPVTRLVNQLRVYPRADAPDSATHA